MSQHNLVDTVLIALNGAGVLSHTMIVGSWCIYFYKHHYQEAEDLSPTRTTDMDLDVSRLKRFRTPVNLSSILQGLGYERFFHSDGSMEFLHPELKLEFLVPEIGRGGTGPFKLPGIGITAQPLRFLNILEQDVIKVEYKGLTVTVPHPVRFALHKLIVSQRRSGKTTKEVKSLKDSIQAIEVLEMLNRMGEKEKIKTVHSSFTRKEKGYVSAALSNYQDSVRIQALEMPFLL